MNSCNPKHQRIDWHAALLSGLQIELKSAEDILSYHPEHVLNIGERRVDILILKEKDSRSIDSDIARIFQDYNLVDYKGPDDSMNVSNFLKALSYACSLPDYLRQPDTVYQLTLTLITHHYPRKLFSYLRKNYSQFTKEPVEKIIDGLYYIHIGLFPIQLIVLQELPPEKYLWLHCLTNHLTKDMPLVELGHTYKSHEDDPLYQTFMNAIIRANSLSKGDEEAVCEALEELFAPRLEAREEKGRAEGVTQGIAQGMTQGISQLSTLISKLLDSNRIDDVRRVTEDPEYREALFAEFNI